MKRMILILSLLTIGCGPLAAQDANAEKEPRSGRDDPTTAEPEFLFSPSVTSLEKKQGQLNVLEQQLIEMGKQIYTQNKEQGDGTWLLTRPSSGTNSVSSVVRLMLAGSYVTSRDLVVVPDQPVNPQQISMMLEDMRIMSRILEKELREFDLPKRQFDELGFVSWGSGKPNIRGLYLDGYGLVFQLQVGFPLISQGEEETSEAEEEPVDKVWHETRQEIFEPARPRSQKSDREEYDPERVEGLKATIARTLRHAANIRTLEENECVVVIVTSSRQRDNNLRPYYLPTQNSSMAMMGLGSPHEASVLSIKATKANIDAFAKKALDLNQFRSRLQVVLY